MTIASLFNHLDRRLKSKDEKEALITVLAKGTGKEKESKPEKRKSGQKRRHDKTVQAK